MRFTKSEDLACKRTIRFVRHLQLHTVSSLMGYFLSLNLIREKGVLFHAAGISIKKYIIILLAESGGGKSTVMKYCKNGQCIHDDKMAILRKNTKWFGLGVPMLDNKGTWGRQDSAPLKGLYLIEKTKKHYLIRLNPIEAFPKVAQFAIEPTGRKDLRKMLSETLMDLVTEVPVYRLGYVLGDDVSKLI